MCGIGLFVGTPDPGALARLRARGPDATHTTVLSPPSLSMVGSVLSMREPFTPQPLSSPLGSLTLAFNGEAYGGPLAYAPTAPANDAAGLLDALATPLTPGPGAADTAQADPATLAASLAAELAQAVPRGEWAVLVWIAHAQTLLWARDSLGRRSLLVDVDPDTGAVAAVASVAGDSGSWSRVMPGIVHAAVWDAATGALVRVPDAAARLPDTLIAGLPPLAPLPAPGPPPPRPLPPKGLHPDAEPGAVPDPALGAELGVGDPEFDGAVDALDAALRTAVTRRIEGLPDLDRIGVLFSGGLDSMVVAALLHEVAPPDTTLVLLNVAFAPDDKPAAYEAAPDRKTGRAGAAALAALTAESGRAWDTVWVDVPGSVAEQTRGTVSRLVAPAATLMDISIGLSLYFASHAAGAPRALMSGLGADELFGGYTRHGSRFRTGGWAALVAELEADVGRLWLRNLGRDDRVVSDAGSEFRTPFLDEDVVELALGLPIGVRTDPRAPRGTGDKRLVRALARRLGLAGAATLPKRAIQFGSRIAKVLPRGNGTDPLPAAASAPAEPTST